jgi:acetyl esterase/lipase
MFARDLPNANKEALLDVYFSPTAVLGMVHTRDQKGNKVLITKQTEKDIFKSWPCTFVVCGDYEVLTDQSHDMVRRLKLSKEAEDKLQERELSFITIPTCHDPFVAPPFIFTKERAQAMQKMVAWLAL